MGKISVPYYSYGTIYGTVLEYAPDGSLIGNKDITGLGVFFGVYYDGESRGVPPLIQKSIGTGASILYGSLGVYTITFKTRDLDLPPNEYYYSIYVGNSTGFTSGTTDIKQVGSGIFEITPGVKIP